MKTTSCVYCHREITNPICAQCHYKHITLWLNDKQLKLDTRGKLVRTIKKSLFLENANDADCVLCRMNDVCVCSYCYFKKVERMLTQMELPEEVMDDFLLTFNYDIYSDFVQVENSEDQNSL